MLAAAEISVASVTIKGSYGDGEVSGVILGLVWFATYRKVLVWPFQPDGTEAETMAAAVWCVAAWDR